MLGSEFTISAFGKTLPEAYHRALKELRKEGNIVNCSDWNTTAKEITLVMNVWNPLAEPRISKLFIGDPRSLKQYIMEIKDGILDFEVERGNWKYTYHNRMTVPVDQIQYVIDELKRNPDSRRAVISIRNVETDTQMEEQPCLQTIQYFIRNGKLKCIATFRSNDACKATFMNAYALIELMKTIAYELGVEVGMYVHIANSFHCYEKDFDMLDGYCKRINEAEFNNDFESVTYKNWDEIMDEEEDEIMNSVNRLKDGGKDNG